MNRPEAELLLGGYATGTLTDAEKRVLFAAAIEHQELFDALLEEETLRELLADPEVRQRLLAVLAPPEVRNVKPLWGRPAFLGVAASLFVLATTSLLVWRSPGYRTLPAAQDGAVAPSQLPAPVAQDTVGSAVSRPASPRPPSPPKAKAAGKPIKAEAEEGPVAPGPVATSQPVLEKKARQEAEGGTIVAEMAAPEPFFREKTETALGASTAKGNLVSAPAVPKTVPPGFRSTLEPLEGGRTRLTVLWGPRGHLYVLQRTPSGATWLPPWESGPGQGGKTRTLFELKLGEKDALDVYVLATLVADPVALPETGVVQGERKRVYPE